MYVFGRSLLALLCVGTAGVMGGLGVQAQNMTVFGAAGIALKSGESQEVTDIYYVLNCKSLLKSTPHVEIVDGPPTVTAEIKEAMVQPRFQRCAAPVKGGKLYVATKEVEDPFFGPLILRVIYDTREGERKFSHTFNLSLIP